MKTLLKLSLIFISYNLNAQNIVISSTLMNIFYVGIDNPIDIGIENSSLKDFFVKTNNGKVIKDGNGKYRLIFAKPGGVDVCVCKTKGKDTINIGCRPFRVKYLPSPTAKIWLSKDTVEKEKLLNEYGIYTYLEGFSIDIRFKITQYTITIIRGKEVILNKEVFDKSFEPIKDIFYNLQTGDKIFFTEIHGLYPDNIDRKCNSFEITIK